MMNLATDALTNEPNSGLAGTASGWLELRLCSDPYRGRTVRLRQTRCIIGSSPACDVRLEAPGVSPVHCLIVRGQQCTVIRNFSPDSRLNGQPFQDELLSAGDRLSLGLMEVEIATLDAGPLPQQRLKEALNDVARLRRQLESLQSAEQSQHETRADLQLQLGLMQQRLAELENRNAAATTEREAREDQLLEQLHQAVTQREQAEQNSKTAQQQADDLQHERTALLHSVQELEARIGELETQLAVIVCERDELARELVQRETQLEQHRSLQQELDNLRREYEQRQIRFEQKQTQFEQQQIQWEQQQDEWQQQQSQWQQQQSQWETERQSLAENLEKHAARGQIDAEHIAQLQELEQKLAVEIAAHEAAFEQWESQRNQLLERIEEAQAESQKYLTASSSEREEMARLEQRCAELQQLLEDGKSDFERVLSSNQDNEAHTRELEQIRDRLSDQLQTQSQQWQTERDQWQSEKEELQSIIEQLRDRISSPYTAATSHQPEASPPPEVFQANDRLDYPQQPVAERQLLADHQGVSDLESFPRDEDYNRYGSQESSNDAYIADESCEQATSSRMVLDDSCEPTGNAFQHEDETYVPSQDGFGYAEEEEQIVSVDSDTVLERLRKAGLLRSDSSTSDDRSSKVESRPIEAQPEPELISELETGEDEPEDEMLIGAAEYQGPNEEDDSSIQQYMDRLLRRVRGSEGPAPAKAKKPAKAPVAEPVKENPEKEQPAEYVTAEQYIPRTSAPEQMSSLAAMRELANDSARTALTTYKQKVGTEGARRLFTYAGVAFMAGLASTLLVMPVSTVVGLGGGAIGFGGAAVLVFMGVARSTRMGGRNS